jgi:hypothetical protein
MTGPKPGQGKEQPRRSPETVAADLRFLRSVFAEITGEASGPAASLHAGPTHQTAVKLVRTRPKCLK